MRRLPCHRAPPGWPARGFTLVETLVALAILAVLAGMAAPTLLASRDDARARGAARHLAAQLQLARFEALKRHANVAVRFEPADAPSGFAVYLDGNANGVRSADIAAQIDRALRTFETVSQQFPGVQVERDPEVPTIDGDSQDNAGAVSVGRSRMVSFSPEGTSTSGTVYLLGRGHRQFAVRILGPTGRVRVFEFLPAAGIWQLR